MALLLKVSGECMANSTENTQVVLTVPPPVLVAHRGYSGRYPENTLLSYEAAYTHGARFMELDLQMTSDAEPVLHHDASLQRMAGVDLDIRETSTAKFKTLKASYKERFTDEFIDNTFTTFSEFCEWLAQYPEVTIFVEIKQESIDHFGLEVFMDAVYQRIIANGVENQCVIISFNNEALEYSRKLSSMQIGWVLPKWNKDSELIAKQLNSEFLFCGKHILPEDDSEIWHGDWQWAIYNLDEVISAINMANRRFSMLETNQIGTLFADKRLKAKE